MIKRITESNPKLDITYENIDQLRLELRNEPVSLYLEHLVYNYERILDSILKLNIINLCLRSFRNVPISSLKCVEHLELICCYNVGGSDLSELMYIPTLIIEDCNRVKNISNMRNCRLAVFNCKFLNTIHGLMSGSNIHIENNHELVYMYDICNIENLYVSNSPKIQRMYLTEIDNLNISNCDSLVDVQLKGNVDTVTIRNCKKFNPGCLQYVRHVTLENIPNVDISVFKNAATITLVNCSDIDIRTLSHTYTVNCVSDNITTTIIFKR